MPVIPARLPLLALAIAVLPMIGSAEAGVVTAADPMGWQAANVRGTGTVAITNTYPDGNGSLQFTTGGSGDKADFVDSWGLVADRRLGNITSLTYDLYRSSSSTAASYLAAAFRLSFYDQASGKTGYLIFEPTYQPPGNSPVTTNQFVTVDMTAGNFWMREFGGIGTVEKYDVTLSQWASGMQQAPGAYVLNANTYIYAIEVGVGSGWSGTFDGAVDNVNVAFGADTINSNFEVVATAVPEPASLALLGLGLGAAGMVRRRRTA